MSDIMDNSPWHEETLQRHWPVFYIVFLIGVVGTIGNSLTLVVYAMRKKKSATIVFIQSIAFVDLLTDVLCIPVILYVLILGSKDRPHYLCKVYFFVNFATATTSAVLLVAVAAVRCSKVCYYFKKQMTARQARWISLALASVCIAFSLPHGLVHGRQPVNSSSGSNVTGYLCRVDDSYLDSPWPLVLNGFFVLLFLVCSTALTFMYTRIGVTAWRHGSVYGAVIVREATGFDALKETKRREASSDVTKLDDLNLMIEKSLFPNEDMPSSNQEADSNAKVKTSAEILTRNKIGQAFCQRRNGRTTRMLLVISVIYVLTNLTSLVLLLLRTADDQILMRMSTAEASAFNVFLASYLINTAVNPVIYSLWDRNFRRQCKQFVFTAAK